MLGAAFCAAPVHIRFYLNCKTAAILSPGSSKHSCQFGKDVVPVILIFFRKLCLLTDLIEVEKHFAIVIARARTNEDFHSRPVSARLLIESAISGLRLVLAKNRKGKRQIA